MLGWSTNELAHAANVGLATVRRFETGRPVQSRPADAMRRALEAAGSEFIAAGEHKAADLDLPCAIFAIGYLLDLVPVAVIHCDQLGFVHDWIVESNSGIALDQDLPI
jgi:hypothetical protein